MSILSAEPSSVRRRPGPEAVAVVSVALLVLAAWAGLVYEASTMAGADALWQAICRPAGRGGADVLGEIAVAAGLWMVMSVAMMLPTAVPMVFAFVDLARRRDAAPRSLAPLALIAGYLGVWAGVSLVAAVLQVGAGGLAGRVPLPAAAGLVLAGMVIGAAGLYQFSDRKLAFLGACRHPLPDLEAGYRSSLGAVARLGVGQGLRCLGCCGPMMAIMLVAGAMNLVWMGLFAILMAVEKTSTGLLVPRLVGGLLLAAGAAVALSSVGPAALLAFLMRG